LAILVAEAIDWTIVWAASPIVRIGALFCTTVLASSSTE
jgi:hypothetical protein